MVKVATVPGTSARRSGCIWSMVWHDRQARVGGMWRKPQTWQRLAAKAYFHCSERWTVGAPGTLGIGPARRLPAQLAAPGQERRVGQVVPPGGHLLGHRWARRASARACCAPASASVVRRTQRVGAVGQRQHDDDLPRLGPLEHVAQRDGGLGRAEVADRPGRGRAPAPRRARRGRLVTALTARTCRPVTTAWSTSPSARPASLSAAAKASRASGHVDLLAEALLPRRASRPRRAPASGRGTRRWPRPGRSARPRRRRARRRRPPRRRRCRAPRPSRPGPVRRSETTASVGAAAGRAGAPSACSSVPTAERDEPAKS